MQARKWLTVGIFGLAISCVRKNSIVGSTAFNPTAPKPLEGAAPEQPLAKWTNLGLSAITAGKLATLTSNWTTQELSALLIAFTEAADAGGSDKLQLETLATKVMESALAESKLLDPQKSLSMVKAQVQEAKLRASGVATLPAATELPTTGVEAAPLPTAAPTMPPAPRIGTCSPLTLTAPVLSHSAFALSCTEAGQLLTVASVGGCAGLTWNAGQSKVVGDMPLADCDLVVRATGADAHPFDITIAVRPVSKIRLMPADAVGFAGLPSRELHMASSSYDGTVQAVSAIGQGVSVTRDGGVTWTNHTNFSSGLPSNFVTAFLWSGDDTLVSFTNGFVLAKNKFSNLQSFRAGNAGGPPASFTRGIGISPSVVVAAGDPGKILVAQRPSLTTWAEKSLPASAAAAQVRQFADAGTSGWFAATTAGLYKSIDSGVSWTLIPTGTVPADVRGVVALGTGEIFALTGGTTGAAHRSIDGGSTWSATNAPCDAAGLVQAAPPLSSGAWKISYGAQWCSARSVDGGATWSTASENQTWWLGLQAGIDSAGTLYGATNNGLQVSPLVGAQTSTSALADMGSMPIYAVTYHAGKYIYASNWGSRRTADFITYETIISGDQSYGAAAGTNYVYINATGSGFVRGDDAGNVTTPNLGVSAWDRKPLAAAGTIVAAASNGGLSVSTDEGATSTLHTTTNGLPSDNVVQVTARGTSVYAATPSGLGLVRPGTLFGGQTVRAVTSFAGLSTNAVSDVCADATGVYAALANGAGTSGGVASFDADLQPTSLPAALASAVGTTAVLHVACDAGRLAVALADGRFVLKSATGEVRVLTPATLGWPVELGMKANIFTLSFAGDSLIVGTEFGAYRL